MWGCHPTCKRGSGGRGCATPQQDIELEKVGKDLYEIRSAYMLKYDIGMTETWNRLTEEINPYYHSEEVIAIRNKRYIMDKIVLSAYGWKDLELSNTKEIITRLRMLNIERHQEEGVVS